MNFAEKLADGLSYERFLEVHGTEGQRRLWQQTYDRVRISKAQRQLLSSFRRQMKVLCVAGAWCGDCIEQCPIFARFAEATPTIDLKFFDRDAHLDMKAALSICGGARVPAVVFLSEDNFEVHRYGDRTLSKYRSMAAGQLGAACPTGITPPPGDLLGAVVQDWLDEFERVQLILRTSPRLREKHGD